MRRSLSLTKAIEAVDAVLSADTDSTCISYLSDVASKASGISVDCLLINIDLAGLDLRGKDVNYLLPFAPRFEGAILSDEQLRMFRSSQRRLKSSLASTRMRDARVDLLNKFIDDYDLRKIDLFNWGTSNLTSDFLKKVLVDPFRDHYRDSVSLDERYMADVLDALGSWAVERNVDFFVLLFSVLGAVQAPAGPLVVSVLEKIYLPAFENDLGRMLGSFHPTKDVDQWWFTLNGEKEISIRIREVSSYREVDASAIEAVLDQNISANERLHIAEVALFDCSPDQAERIALRLTRSKWPPRDTQKFLNAKTNTRVRNAIFRQILAQGDEGRVIEVLRWLDDERGAAGALSLEDGLSKIKDFDLVFKFAKQVLPRIGGGQAEMIFSALNRLSRNAKDRDAIEILR